MVHRNGKMAQAMVLVKDTKCCSPMAQVKLDVRLGVQAC
jgi:hypothetical protein